MASPGGIDGKDFCNDIKNINGIALASIKKFLGKTKSCGTCTEVNLSTSRVSSLEACNTSCTTYYTDAADSDNIQVGESIFTDSACTTAPTRAYFSNKCGGRSGSWYRTDTAGSDTSQGTC